MLGNIPEHGPPRVFWWQLHGIMHQSGAVNHLTAASGWQETDGRDWTSATTNDSELANGPLQHGYGAFYRGGQLQEQRLMNRPALRPAENA